ncbi:cation:proton antiporter [Brevibacillus daliensis]|uniref:cation:proton antiporter n=1 Tax=Brevibacillus daliensis TaxID=2892995 RepID=UPI001E4672A0|nr:cation:proton antiporter [Brevibacillus daliensis]
MELLLQLLIIILFTKLAGDLAVKLGQPSVLGKLIIGVIIGPAVLGWIHPSEVIKAFSDLGVIFLMFFAGLETNLKELNRNRNAAVVVAGGGIILPMIGGYICGIFMGMEPSHALFLGLLLSATSVSISVQTFRELGQLRSKECTTVLGAAIVDDIVVVIALAVMMSFLTADQVSLGLLIGKKVLFFVIVILLGWKVVPWFMRKFSNLSISESVISAGVFVCLFFAFIGEYLGVAGIIGAFAAGIAIAQTDYHHEVERKLEPIAYAIFVPVFFVSIGLNLSLEGIGGDILIIVILTIVAVLTKLIGSGLGAKLTGFNFHSSVVIGAGMVSRGEVALIIAAMGLESGLLSQDYFTIAIVVVIMSTIITPPLLKILMKDSKVTETVES